MIIQHSLPASTVDAARQTASASSAQEEGRFAGELKKQLSSGEAQDARQNASPQESMKKPADKKAQLADAAPATTVLPADLLTQAANTLPMPLDTATTTADALLAQGIQTAQPDLAALPQVSAEPALAATPASPLLAAALPAEPQAGDPLTQVNFTAVLDEQKPTQDLPAGVKPQPARPEAQPAMPLTASTVEGKAPSLTSADSSPQATTPVAAPLSESLTQALHNLKAAEPVATPHIVAQAAPVTATAPATAIATSTVATATLQAEVGTPGWQQSLGQQIAVFSRNGVHHAELRLHPEELGALQVSLRVNNDQAQVHFVSESHHVRAALESAMPTLRTMLEQSGLSLGQSSVGADTPSSAGDAYSGNASGQGKSESGQGEVSHSPEDETPVVTRVMHYSRGINTFA
ncbi:flagellar hook-length control protein FliK [Kosakonia cowanii]|uniref:flagellar hook-length control protein FliK n=1 Tax=Kosakonia cowanii TaxID=208223 RepID=UPI0023F7DECB|nr:flagellar hook-length control protein FliK [Kosakonia cowanii]MDF7759618.1 flagellar hook-length control protein FliK [Kosakonia cowanii]